MTTLAEIKSRLEKATPGPWRGDRYDGTIKYFVVGHEQVIDYDNEGEPRNYVLQVDHKNGTSGFENERDAELVLSAPTDIAYLLGVIERCKPYVEGWRNHINVEEEREKLELLLSIITAAKE